MTLKEIGILDPDGKHKNPLNGKKYSDIYLETANNKENGWRFLPIYKKAKEIIKQIKEHQVMVIESGTGTGKTVILPKLAIHALDYKGKVVMTIPKVAPTESSARYAAKCLDVEIGKEVGFQYSGATLADVTTENDEEILTTKSAKSADTKILFSTEGSVLSQFVKNPDLREYDIIIIDEAHERSLAIDMLLLYLREALVLNPKLKVIITSATLPKGLFENYFREKGIDVGENNVSSGPLKKVDLFYSSKDVKKKDRMPTSIETFAKKIEGKNLPGDVLFFGASNPELKKTCQELVSKYRHILCMEISSGTLKKDEELEGKATGKNVTFEEEFSMNYKRKVLIATNVWESSVTLANLIFVLDNGLEFVSQYDPEKMQQQLIKGDISKSQAIQRKGRVGRTFPGVAYRSYSEKQYDSMIDDPVVPIRRSDITDILLNLFQREEIYDLGDLINLLRLFIEKPKKSFVLSSLKTLEGLGLLTGITSESILTNKGKVVNYISGNKVNNLMMATSLYYSKLYDCSKEMSMLAGIISVGVNNVDDLFYEPFNRKEEIKFERAKRSFKEPEGDLFSIYEIVKRYLKAEYRDIENLNEWTGNNFLKAGSLGEIVKRARLIYKKLPKRSVIEEQPEYDISELNDRLLYCLIKGYFPNLAQKHKSDKKGCSFFQEFISNYKNLCSTWKRFLCEGGKFCHL